MTGSQKHSAPLGAHRNQNNDCVSHVLMTEQDRGLACTVCDRRDATNFLCSGCGAIAFCSKRHERDYRSIHRNECPRFREQMQEAEALASFPLSWAVQACRNHLDVEQFLKGIGSAHAIFCTLTKRQDASGNGLLGLILLEYAEALSEGNLAQFCLLPQSFTPPRRPLRQAQEGNQPATWEATYAALSLPLDSPFALIADLAATIHAVIAESDQLRNKEMLSIHVLGCESEVDRWPVLLLLCLLWPDKRFHVLMNGVNMHPKLSGWFLGLTIQTDNTFKASARATSYAQLGSSTWDIVVTFEEGLYHERFQEANEAADMVICPNAGIVVYDSWRLTLQLLLKGSSHLVITDYGREAMCLTHGVVKSEIERMNLSRTLSELSVNPFRRPMSFQGADNCLPSYSNGFAVHVR